MHPHIHNEGETEDSRCKGIQNSVKWHFLQSASSAKAYIRESIWVLQCKEYWVTEFLVPFLWISSHLSASSKLTGRNHILLSIPSTQSGWGRTIQGNKRNCLGEICLLCTRWAGNLGGNDPVQLLGVLWTLRYLFRVSLPWHIRNTYVVSLLFTWHVVSN